MILIMEAWGTFVELLKHWGRDKMAAIAQTTFSNAFSWMKMYKFHLKCFFDLRLNKRLSKQSSGWWFETLSRPLCRHRNDNFVPKGPIDNIPALVLRVAWCRTGRKPFSEPMMEYCPRKMSSDLTYQGKIPEKKYKENYGSTETTY